MRNLNILHYFSNGNNLKCNKQIVIPDGFRELLQDMTVEVLRNQPPDLITFCINWLTNRKNERRERDESVSSEIQGDKKKFGFGQPKGSIRLSIKGGPEKYPKKFIEDCKLFANIEKSLVTNFSNKFEIKDMDVDEKVTIESKPISDKIYIIQKGTFELFNVLPFGKTKIADLVDEGYFGDTAEKLACIAKSPGKLIIINRSDIDHQVMQIIEERRVDFKEFIDDLELLETLNLFDKRMIIDSMVLQSFPAGETIIKENDEANEMFLLYEGFVSIKKDGKEIGTVNEGGYFGELAILDNQPRAATVECISDVKVLSICAATFKSYIEPKCSEYMDKVIKTYFGEADNNNDDDNSSVMESPPLEKVNVPRKSVSAGKFNPEMDDDDDEDEDDLNDEMNKYDFSKTDEQRNRLRVCCQNILLFRCLDDEQLEVVIDSMFQKVVVPEDVIITRGEDGDNFYVIDSGLYDIIVPVNGVDTVVAHYDNKGSFGELALMYNTPRSATVIAKTNGLLWAMTRDMFRKIVLKKAFQKRVMYDKLLSEVPFLKELSSFERNNVSDALRTRVYEPDSFIIKQGEEGLEMYFMEEGTARIYIEMEDDEPPHELGEVTTGKYFGEMALINKKPRAATIQAVTKCKIAVLDRESFERLLGPCVEIMKRNMLTYESVPPSRMSLISKGKGK